MDGRLENQKVLPTDTADGILVLCNGAPGSLGRIGDLPGEGSVDEVRVYDRALSAEEIAATFDRRIAGDTPGLVLYWDMDDLQGAGAGIRVSNRAATPIEGVGRGSPGTPYSEPGSAF